MEKRIACNDVVPGCTFTATAATEEELLKKVMALYRIVTNAALMHRRARTRRPVESLESFLPAFDATGSHRHAPAELQVAARADELLDRRFLAEQATAALDRLPDLYRSAFVLRDLEELSTAEVAQALGIEPATVRQRVHRARLMLRGYLNALAGVKS
jgi:RNA polymerase sigma-70 factor (ECF subfamily)